MKEFYDVPGWKYWYETKRGLWIGERRSRRITSNGGIVRLVVAMMSDEKLPDCTYEQIGPSLSAEELRKLSDHIKGATAKYRSAATLWKNEGVSWAVFLNNAELLAELVSSNVDEIISCIDQAAQAKGSQTERLRNL